MLHRRIHEHGTRLKRQEVGLKASLETIDKIRVEEAALIASVGYLTSERETWLMRALVDGRGESSEDSRGDVSFGDVGVDDLRSMLEDKARRVDELETEKDKLQLRCRELQVSAFYRWIRRYLRANVNISTPTWPTSHTKTHTHMFILTGRPRSSSDGTKQDSRPQGVGRVEWSLRFL